MSQNNAAGVSKSGPADSPSVPERNSQCDSIVISEDFVLMATPDNFKDNNDSDKEVNDDDDTISGM